MEINPVENLIKKKDKLLSKLKGKKALVVRLGAVGDMIMISPVLRALKNDGYQVVLNTQPYGKTAVWGNPNIDAFFMQNENQVPIERLDEYWGKLGIGFDKMINLTGSVEGDLLKPEGSPEFSWTKERRHEECNKNYVDYSMGKAGYPITAAKTEMFFTKAEHKWAKNFRNKYRGKFVIIWSLYGSSPHKAYPYAEYAATEFLDRHKDVIMITVGGEFGQILEWNHPRTKNWSGRETIRKVMLLTQYVDLVVGTETGVLNAAGCYNTPKIIFLSHSTEENLTKHWTNAYPIYAPISCYPCHQLHYTFESCKLNSKLESPLCMTMIPPEVVVATMEEIYKKEILWRQQH